MDYVQLKSSYDGLIKDMLSNIKYYLEIMKPGIIFGNIILIIGSFLLGSKHYSVDFFLFLCTIFGTSLVIASACIFNNILDSDIDKQMTRTRNRVLSKNLLSFLSASIFAIFLGILGVSILGLLVNFLSMIFAIIGFVIYVILYTFLKRQSMYSTLIGSFSGSIPSIVGYTAISNTVDICAILLFLIFVCWQISHFYAISILRIEDYKTANIPVFSVVKGIDITKKHIFYYIIGFILFSSLLTFCGYLSYIFLFLSSIINFYWLFLAYSNIKNNHNIKNNSRKLFYLSIIVVIYFNFLLSIDFLF